MSFNRTEDHLQGQKNGSSLRRKSASPSSYRIRWLTRRPIENRIEQFWHDLAETDTLSIISTRLINELNDVLVRTQHWPHLWECILLAATVRRLSSNHRHDWDHLEANESTLNVDASCRVVDLLWDSRWRDWDVLLEWHRPTLVTLGEPLHHWGKRPVLTRDISDRD